MRFAHLDPFRFAELGAEDLRHALQVRSARVKRLVNPVANTHDFFLLLKTFGDIGVHLVERADFLEHFDDSFIQRRHAGGP